MYPWLTVFKTFTKALLKITWSKVEKKSCYSNTYSGSYTDKQKALAACEAMGSECAGVYDNRCDDAGIFALCKACGPSVWASSTSCVYTAKIVPQTSGLGVGVKCVHECVSERVGM